MPFQRRFFCKRGHRMVGKNIIWRDDYTGRGRMVRRCRECENMRVRARRKTEKGRKAVQERRRRGVEKRRATGLPPGDPRHGRPVGYTQWYCRCDLCKAWSRQYNRDRAAKRKRSAELAELCSTEGSWAKRTTSLDALAAARYGMDRISVTGEWDDPTWADVEDRLTG